MQGAKAYLESEHYDEALKALKEASKRAPRDERPFLIQADILLKLKKRSSAIRSLIRAAGAGDGKSSSLGVYGQRRLATLLEERKLLFEAALTFAQALKIDDEVASREDLIKAGQLFQRAEKPITAGQWFLKALEASTNQTDRENVLISLRESLTEAKHLEWLSIVLKNRIEDPVTAPPDIVKALANVYIDRNRQLEAITLLESAAGGPPPLGYAARYVSGAKESKVISTPLGQRVPSRVIYLRALVPLYSGVKGGTGDILKAFSALRELSRLDPGQRWRYALAEGIAQFRRKKHNKEALKIFKMVLVSAPANAPVFSDLARRFAEFKDTESALEAAQKAIVQEPRDGRRHWLAIELIRRHMKGDEQQRALLKKYRRFVQSGVNSQDLEQARDDLYELLLLRSEALAARHEFSEAAACASESRSLASNAEARARSQLLGAVLKLKSPDALNALEILQGGMGRYRKEWILVGQTKIRASILASAWLQQISGQAYEIYQKQLAPRGEELFEVASKHNDRDLLQRLSRLFPFAPQARQVHSKRVAKLIKRSYFEEALWVLENLKLTKPKRGADPLKEKLAKWNALCRGALGEQLILPPKSLESRPRRSFRSQSGASNTQAKSAVRVGPIVYGQRMFFLQGKSQLLAIDLNKIFKKQSGTRSQESSAARFKLGQATPTSSVIYNLTRPNNYYYFRGTLGVASYPNSLDPLKRLTRDPDIVWQRKITGLAHMKAIGGRLFVASESIQALSPRTGHVLWRYGNSRDRSNPTNTSRSAKAAHVMALEVSNSKIFALFSNGECVSLNPKTGERLWQSSDLGQFGNGQLRLIKAAKELLLVARGDQVFSLLADSGKRLWIGDNITAAASAKNELRKRSSKHKKKNPQSQPAKSPSIRGKSTIVYSSGPVGYGVRSANTLYKMPAAGTPLINLSYNYGTSSRYSTKVSNQEAPEMWVTKKFVVLHNHKGSLAAYNLNTGKIATARYYTRAPKVTVHGEKLYVLIDKRLEVIELASDKQVNDITLKNVAAGPPLVIGEQILIPGTNSYIAIATSSGLVL